MTAKLWVTARLETDGEVTATVHGGDEFGTRTAVVHLNVEATDRLREALEGLRSHYSQDVIERAEEAKLEHRTLMRRQGIDWNAPLEHAAGAGISGGAAVTNAEDE